MIRSVSPLVSLLLSGWFCRAWCCSSGTRKNKWKKVAVFHLQNSLMVFSCFATLIIKNFKILIQPFLHTLGIIRIEVIFPHSKHNDQRSEKIKIKTKKTLKFFDQSNLNNCYYVIYVSINKLACKFWRVFNFLFFHCQKISIWEDFPILRCQFLNFSHFNLGLYF